VRSPKASIARILVKQTSHHPRCGKVQLPLPAQIRVFTPLVQLAAAEERLAKSHERVFLMAAHASSAWSGCRVATAAERSALLRQNGRQWIIIRISASGGSTIIGSVFGLHGLHGATQPFAGGGLDFFFW